MFDWKRYVMTLTHLPEVGVLDVDEEERIINRSPRYFKSLIDVLKTTSKRSVRQEEKQRDNNIMTGKVYLEERQI